LFDEGKCNIVEVNELKLGELKGNMGVKKEGDEISGT
jgi:hypothetical protein